MQQNRLMHYLTRKYPSYTNYKINNSTSPQITTGSNFTITVLPPLGLSEQISIIWSGFYSAINGFVTLFAATIGIGCIIGG